MVGHAVIYMWQIAILPVAVLNGPESVCDRDDCSAHEAAAQHGLNGLVGYAVDGGRGLV